MKYVSEKYEHQLQDLAELLVTPERYQHQLHLVGETALAEVIELHPTVEQSIA